MKKQILESLDRLHYFSIESFMQIADLTENEKAKARNLLSRAVKANQIIRLKNGLYITRNFYERFHQDARFQPVISQIINPYSYVSSLYILQKENIIPEAVLFGYRSHSKKYQYIQQPDRNIYIPIP